MFLRTNHSKDTYTVNVVLWVGGHDKRWFKEVDWRRNETCARLSHAAPDARSFLADLSDDNNVLLRDQHTMFTLRSIVSTRLFSTSALLQYSYKLKSHQGAKKRWRSLASGVFKRVKCLVLKSPSLYSRYFFVYLSREKLAIDI